MQIRVKGYLTYRDSIGDQVVQFEDGNQVTLGDLLAALFSAGGNDLVKQVVDGASRRSGRVAILVNGRHYTQTPERLQLQLKDGDEIAIFPPIAGGSGLPICCLPPIVYKQ